MKTPYDNWTLNERKPDGGNAPYNERQGNLVNSKPQPICIPIADDSAVEEIRNLIAETREKIQPLSEPASVILTPTPSN